jgi:hypothetical protein
MVVKIQIELVNAETRVKDDNNVSHYVLIAV